uniref:TIL domain-containing protein n=1 Tax=Amblyomma maculatum TaxID=34609 RepID=G3MTR0_AMBMU
MPKMTSIITLAVFGFCCSRFQVLALEPQSLGLQIPTVEMAQQNLEFPDFSQAGLIPPQSPHISLVPPPLPKLDIKPPLATQQTILNTQWTQQLPGPPSFFPPILLRRRCPSREVPACRSVRCGERYCSDRFKPRPLICRRPSCSTCVCRWPFYRNDFGKCVMVWKCQGADCL